MAAKKNSAAVGNILDGDWGGSLTAGTWSWKKDGGVVTGTIKLVELVTGPGYKGKGEKTQTRVTLSREDGSVVAAYMPERWATVLAPWTGSLMRLSTSDPGKTETRYDAKPAKGAKPVTPVPVIPQLRQEERDDAPKRKARAKTNARKALRN